MVERVRGAKAAVDAKVAQAQDEAAPVAAAVKTALVAVADTVGEAQTADLLGVSPREIRSALRSPAAHPRAGRPASPSPRWAVLPALDS